MTRVNSLDGGNFHRRWRIWFAYLLRSILPEGNERLLYCDAEEAYDGSLMYTQVQERLW